MAGLHFDITGENSNFLSALEGAKRGVKTTADAMEQYGQQIESMFERIKSAAELSLAGFTAKGFAEKVAQTRGQFQQLEIAFKTMLGSAEEANTLMNQLVNTAATTPFDLKGVADGAKQLLAYGTEAKEVNGILVRLGDIAAGLSIPLGDLVYLYGTTMTQGRMYTQDLHQFMGRGIPMADEIAKIFGVAKDEVAGLVTAGKVGAEQVKQAIVNMTSEGGKFGGLMEAQSKSITGQISNIEDAIDMMFNDMGKSSEGAINTVLSGVSYAVENYEKFGTVITGVIAAYGEWKAAAMVVSGWHNMISNQMQDIEATRQASLGTVAEKYHDTSDTASTAAETAAEEQNTIARNANRSAIDGQIASIEASLKAKVAETEAAHTAAVEQAAQASLAVDAANEAVQAAQEQYDAAVQYSKGEAIESAENALNTATLEANTAATNLQAAREEVATAATARNTAATRLQAFQTEVDTVQKTANTTATGLWAAVTNTATTAVKGLTAAVAANPVGALLVGITTVLSILPLFTSEAAEASEEVTRFGEAAVKQTNEVETLMAVIESTSTTSNVHKDAVDDLCKIYEEYGVHIDTERNKMEQLVLLHDELVSKIHAEGEERQKANLIQSYTDGITSAQEEMQKAWSEAYKNAGYEGTGLFSNTDAMEFQNAADQISLVANTIAQDEMRKLQEIIESGGEVTEKQISDAIASAKAKIEEQSQKLSEASLFMTTNDTTTGEVISHYLDVDYEGIMETYADKTLRLAEARKSLADTMKNGADATEADAKSIDYASMSIDELIEAAYGAKGALDEVNDTEAKPQVKIDSVQEAKKAVQGVQSAMALLNNTTASPYVDTTSLGVAISQAGTLINRLNSINGDKGTQFKFNTNNLGLNVGKTQIGFTQQMFPFSNPLQNDSKAAALAELHNRVSGANSNKKVNDLLKEIGTSLDEAEYGSDEYKQLLQLKTSLEAKKKKNSGKTTTKSKHGKSDAEKAADKRQKISDEIAKVQQESVDAELDIEDDGLQKKLAQREASFNKEIQQLQKQAREWKKANKEAKMSSTTSSIVLGDKTYGGLTKEQAAALSQRQNVAKNAYEKDRAGLYKDYDPSADRKEKEEKLTRDIKAMEKSIAELEKEGSTEAVNNMKKRLQYAQAMLQVSQTQSQIDYLKSSKSIYEQHEGNLMDLQNQRSQIDPNDSYALMANDRAVEEENTRFADQLVLLQTGVDELWRNFETLSSQALEKLEAQLKDAVENGVNGKKISQELARELQTKLKDIKLQLETGGSTGGAFGDGKFFGQGGIGGNTWIGKIGQSLKKVNDSQAKYQADKAQWEQDKSALAEAQKQQADLQSQYMEAKDAGDMQKAQQMQQQLAQAQQAAQAAQAAQASSGAQASSSASAASGSSGAAAFAITDAIIHGVNQNIQSFQQAAKYLWDEDSDMYKSVSKFAESSQHATDGFDSFKNGDFMGAALNVGEAVNDLGDALGIWSNSNYDDWADTNEELINSQNTLTAAINSLADDMKDQTAGQAFSTKEQMVSYAEQQMQAAQQTLQNNANLHEGGHSLWYDFDDTDGANAAVANIMQYLYKKTGNEKYKNLGTGIGDMAEIDARDAELLLKDQEGVNLLTAWSQKVAAASDSGNYGAKGNWYEDWLSYVQNYGSDYFQGIEDSFYETVNGLSFDSFKENFISMMMDLDSEVDDFADSFNEQLTQSIMTDTVNDLYKDDLEQLYQDWGNLMTKRTGDNALSDEEFYEQAEELQQREADISAKIISTRDEIAAATGYDDNESQKATRSSIENITQDQADQLIGRITAIQIAVEASNAATATQTQNTLNSYNVLMSMNNSMSLANNSLSDILLQHVQSNSYLADIVKTQRSIYEELEGRIEKMSNKLETL